MKWISILLLIIITAIDSSGAFEDQEDVVISTSWSQLSGLVSLSIPNDNRFYSFLGIPYAKPPVGNLRFKKPEPINLVNSGSAVPVNAKEKAPVCVQLSMRNPAGQMAGKHYGEEDCLYLNVFVPEKLYKRYVNSELQKKYPVMVWIHGGGFLAGSGNSDFYGPEHFMDSEEVLVVTINYRLGALGFLSLMNHDTPGNMGMWDQIMALKWIQKHIPDFGGDPGQVTIFGESAGGISIMNHVLSKQSKGLFQRAITQSGPGGYMPAMHLQEPPLNYAFLFSNQAGCAADGKVLECLQKASIADLMKAQQFFQKFTLTPNPWKPIVDDFMESPSVPLFHKDPEELLITGDYNQVPILIGGNEDEGCLYMIQFLMSLPKFEAVNRNINDIGPLLFLGTDGDKTTEMETIYTKDLLEFYLDGSINFELDNWHGIKRLFTDVMFLAPIHKTVEMFQRHSHEIYYYNYRYRGQATLADSYQYDGRAGDLGTCHGDDLFILFHQDKTTKTKEDMRMAQKMVKMWVNFAQGKSTGMNPVTANNNKFHNLDLGPVEQIDSSEWKKFSKRMEFTNRILVDLYHRRRNEKISRRRRRRHDEL